jgi:uncharacterized protein
MELPPPLLIGRPPISGYGRGGFRLGGIEHAGSVLILPDCVYAWPVEDAAQLSEDAVRPVLDKGAALGFFILGTGASQIFPGASLRERFASAGIALEAMDTGAACRTYNILLAEERVFAAAMIALS